jgi:secreted trypsin-like serine protease
MTFSDRLPIVLLMMLMTTACAPKGDSSKGSEASVGILGGQDVQANDPVASTTIALYDETSGSLCSGSLIADDTVLTAAHCVDPSSKELYVAFTKNISDKANLKKSEMVRATLFQRHALYDPNQNEGLNTHDLAIVHFEGGLPIGYRTTTLSANVSSIQQKDAELIAAGYGVSNGFFNTGSGVLRKAKLLFRQLHSQTEFRTGQDAQGVCSGDSGGPLYQLLSGQLIQVGVASRVASKFLTCRDYAVYTRVDSYKDWIAETTTKLRDAATP